MLPLLIICVVVSGVLAGVYQLTYEKIEENLDKDMKVAIEGIFGEGITYTELTDKSESDCFVFEVKMDNGVIGYAANVMADGFGGTINMMVGYETNGQIKSVKIISLSETPGLGSRVDDETYLSQYTGTSGELVLKEDVDAIAGATISSKAVLAGVNRANSVLSDAGFIGGDGK